MNVMSRTLITHKGRTIGYETLDATGRHFHLGPPPRTHQAPVNRCPECGAYMARQADARGRMPACTNCGWLDAPQPAQPNTPAAIPMPIPPQPWYLPIAQPPAPGNLPFTPVPWEPKTGPETMGARLDDAIRARASGRVGNFWALPAFR